MASEVAPYCCENGSVRDDFTRKCVTPFQLESNCRKYGGEIRADE